MSVPLLSPRRLWACPNCDHKSLTNEASPHTRFHACAGFGGFTMPMVEAGVRAKVELVEREDYVGREVVTLHEGRPVMAAVTTRDEGQDVAVFAPKARGELA